MSHGPSEAVLNPPQRLLDAAAIADASDGQLLAQFAARRDEMAEIAFETLVHRHGPMVLRVCSQVLGDRHIAEDAFQATFLILARRAGSIQQPALLGNWLHGVALRTAREAKMRNDRRRRRESQRGQTGGEEPSDRAPRPEQELGEREELEALHEEVSRLPERYRIPIVLCELEGLTHQQAAQRLCCPPGTISVRLRRAREHLRLRLTRRGLAPTAGLLGILSCGDNAAAAMSAPLVDSTVQAAMRLGSSPCAAAALVSPSVFALAEGVLRSMALTRLKAAIGLAIAVGIAAAVWARAPLDAPELGALEPGDSRTSVAERPATQVELQPATIEPTGPRSLDEAAHAVEGVGPLLAGQLNSTPPAHAVAEALPASAGTAVSVHNGGGTVKGSLAAEAKLESHPAPARARPAIPDEQARGAALFAKEWMPDDPRSHGGDGLGPVYNDTSCVACHSLGAPGGAGPENKNAVLIAAIPNGCGPSSSLDEILPGLRGSRSVLLHRYSTDPGYPAWRSRLLDPQREGQAKATANRGEDPVASRIRTLRERTSPDRRMRDRSPNSAPVNGFNLTLVERNTPALFGAGKMDQIPSEVLAAVAASQPRQVRGRVGRTREGRIGRFGWKAQIPNLHEFVRIACANELGLEVPGHPQAASPLAPGSKAKGLDLGESECDALVAYIRALPAPVVVDPNGPQGSRDLRDGRRLFAEVGCATCHVPTLGDVKGIYSDLLLHDMGQTLSDPAGSYGLDGPNTAKGPSPREWRTPPLWGYRDSAPYLHDGRAQGLEEAVALHDGQARASAREFFSRSWHERNQIEAFLKSLVAPSSAAAPGIMLAAELESRLEREQTNPAPAERQVRRQREEAAARDEQRWREAKRHEFAQDAAKRARARIPLAQSLEKMGKTTGAISFYREIARDAAGTKEGQFAAERINVLTTRNGMP
jgi:RNA polymerase sigma factor (sigma-70 family)